MPDGGIIMHVSIAREQARGGRRGVAEQGDKDAEAALKRLGRVCRAVFVTVRASAAD